MGYNMNGFSGFGNSPAKQSKKKKSDLYVIGTGDFEGGQDTSFLPKNTKYKVGDDLDETDYEENHPKLAETNLVQDITQVKTTNPKKLKLKFSKGDFEKYKSQ